MPSNIELLIRYIKEIIEDNQYKYISFHLKDGSLLTFNKDILDKAKFKLDYVCLDRQMFKEPEISRIHFL